jgi:hypothetical protein
LTIETIEAPLRKIKFKVFQDLLISGIGNDEPMPNEQLSVTTKTAHRSEYEIKPLEVIIGNP